MLTVRACQEALIQEHTMATHGFSFKFKESFLQFGIKSQPLKLFTNIYTALSQVVYIN